MFLEDCKTHKAIHYLYDYKNQVKEIREIRNDLITKYEYDLEGKVKKIVNNFEIIYKTNKKRYYD